MSWAKVAATAAHLVQPKVKPAVAPVPAPVRPVDKRSYVETALADLDELEFDVLTPIAFDSNFNPTADGEFRGWDLSSFKVSRVLRSTGQIVLSNGPKHYRLSAISMRTTSHNSIDGVLDLKGDVINYIVEQPLTVSDRIRIQKYNMSGDSAFNMTMRKYMIIFDDDTYDHFFAITKYCYEDDADLMVEMVFENAATN